MKRNGLKDFVDFILQQDFAHLSVLETFDYGSVLSLVLYRDARWQAEQFILRAGMGFPRQHRHPNVDSYEFILSTHVPLIVNGVDVSRGASGMGHDVAGAGMNRGARYRVDATDWHGVGDVPNGGSFLSLQEWKNGVKPTSAGLNWQGQPVSAKHRRLLKQTDSVWIEPEAERELSTIYDLYFENAPR